MVNFTLTFPDSILPHHLTSILLRLFDDPLPEALCQAPEHRVAFQVADLSKVG